MCLLKVELSCFKKVGFICFNKSPFKNDKAFFIIYKSPFKNDEKCFLFHFIHCFRPSDLKFCTDFFVKSLEEGSQEAIKVLPNISRSKGNQK